MAAPPKPWERSGVSPGFRGVSQEQNLGQPINQRSTTAGLSSHRNFQSPTSTRTPPPLPTRPSQQQNSPFGAPVNRYGFGSSSSYGLGSYGGGMYGNYGGMYSSYGGGGMYGSGFGYGQRPFGMGGMNDTYSRFVQQAEESSRPAFQSIESIVQAFASVSMMLESTFHTVYNSFRAVLGVAEHFSRLKVHLAKIFSAIAAFRFLRYIYRKLLVLLRLRNSEFADEVWREAETQVTDGALATLPNGKQKSTPSWPIFMFFAVVVGGPYIIWKLLSSNEEDESSSPDWATGEEDHVVARAEYDFDGDGDKELSFHTGNFLNLAPKELQPRVRGWLLASTGGKKIGLIPANYVKILGKRRGRKHSQQTQLQTSQSLPNLDNELPTNQRLNRANSTSVVSRNTNTNASSSRDQTIPSDFGADFLTSDPSSGSELTKDSASGQETDFIFDGNIANSSTVSASQPQPDFAGFDDAYCPESSNDNIEEKIKS